VGRRSQTCLDLKTFMIIINNHIDNTDNIHRTVTVKGKTKENTKVDTSLIVDIIIPHNYKFVYIGMKKKKKTTQYLLNTHHILQQVNS